MNLSAFSNDDRVALYNAGSRSYAKNCGTNAVKCAESDLLGEVIASLREMCDLHPPFLGTVGSPGSPARLRQDEEDAACRKARAVLARIGGVK